MSETSPRNLRIDYGDGAFGYENADGSRYYNDGQGFSQYDHPDPHQCWQQYGDEREYAALNASADGYIEQPDELNDEEMPDAPPPYTEHEEPLASVSPPRPRQTARRGGSTASRGAKTNSTRGRSGNTAPSNFAKGSPGKSSVSRPASSPSTTTKGIKKTQSDQTDNNNVKDTAKKPAKKKCSNCDTTGHDSRICPLNRYGLGKRQEQKKAEAGALEISLPIQTQSPAKKPVKKKCG